MGDAALRKCCRATRGTWMDILCLMAQGTPYGHLADGNGALPMGFVAAWCGLKTGALLASLKELATHGVFSRTATGIIYSRRMVRDENIRRKRASGGNRSLENAKVPRRKDILKDTLEGYPSRTSIKDTLKDVPIGVGGGVITKPPPPTPPPASGNFAISDSEFPELTQAVQSRFPSADGGFIFRIAQDAIQGALSKGIDPRLVTDHVLAEAVKTSLRTDDVRGAGLLLLTVPRIIQSWGKD